MWWPEAARGWATDSPRGSPERTAALGPLILPPEDQFWNADLQNCGDNKCVLFCTVKFMIQCHSSNRKLETVKLPSLIS